MHIENIISPRLAGKDKKGFSKNYALLYGIEKRNYADEEVAKLPVVPLSHPHFQEWQTRKRTCKKLMRYLEENGGVFTVLEIGCGNGWLCSRLASMTSGTVTGTDIFPKSIDQARRVFGWKQNSEFILGDIRDKILPDKKYDLIIFSSGMQYFPSLKEIITLAIKHLTLMGQIHIIDSHFFYPKKIVSARQKTNAYYQQIGLPEMALHHFHHRLDELRYFQYKIVYNPSSWFNKLVYTNTPFYHIIIKNHYR